MLVIWRGDADVAYVLYSCISIHPYHLLNISDFLATFGAFMAVRIAIANFVHISGAGIPVFHRSALEPSAIFHCNINFPAANGGHSPYPRAQQRIQDPATQRRRTSPLPCPFRHGVLGAELENWQYGKAGCTRMRAKAGLHTHLLVLHR